MKLLLAALVFVGSAFGGGAPSPAWSQEGKASSSEQRGGVYRRPLGGDPATMDPARIADIYGLSVIQQMFDGLVNFDGTLSIRPAIAQFWQASRDGLTWTFQLKRGVKFHHGREVTSEDVVHTFQRILDPRVKSGAADLFINIKGAREFREGKARHVSGLEAVDPYTVRVTQMEASVPFVSVLAVGHAKIVPKDLVEKQGESFGLHPVGTGPFKFLRWERNERIVLEANPAYFEGRPKLDRIEYRVFRGERHDEMLQEFLKGNLEDSPIAVKERQRVLDSKAYQYFRRPMFGIRFFGFNTRRKPLDDPRVRQALNHAIDKRALLERIHLNQYVEAVGILPPGTQGYNPGLSGYQYDPQRARELLAAAGYPGGKNLPVISILTGATKPEDLEEHREIKRQLAEVGVPAEFVYNSDWPAFSRMLTEGAVFAFRYSWYADIPDPDNFLFKLFFSKSPRNFTFYANPRVDDLLLQAKRETDQKKRVELYREAERLILTDAPIIPFNYYTFERLFQPYVRSVEVNGLGDPYIPFRKIWLDRK